MVVWGKRAEDCHPYRTVGRQVCVEGPLHLRQYADQAGQYRTVTEMTARRVVFLGDEKSQEEIEEEQGSVDDAVKSELSPFDDVPW